MQFGHLVIGRQEKGILLRRTLKEAQADLAAWLTRWQQRYARLTDWAEDAIGETLTFYMLPRQHHKHLKSTNMLERLNEVIYVGRPAFGLGVRIDRVMTDNGSCYRSAAFRKSCAQHGLRHLFTRPYTPQTNGKAERFIQTALREWAYARAYDTSRQRAAELPYWIHRYNWHRPHGSIGSVPPISTLGLTGNNLLRLHN
mgnify:CR=1 FL=1